MSPEEKADDYDRLLKLYSKLQDDYRKLQVAKNEDIAKERVRRKPAPSSPRGTIDSRGVKDSGKVGIAGGLVGAWSDDVMGHIDAGMAAAGGTIKYIYGIAMVADIVGFCVGFVVLGVATAFVKVAKEYG